MSRIDDVKSYLKRTLSIDRELESVVMEYERIFSKTLRTSSFNENKVQSTPTENIEDVYVELAEYAEVIKNVSNNLRKHKVRVSEQISNIKDEKHRSLLRFRYTIGLDWDGVAHYMNYNVDYTKQLHGQSLVEFFKANPDFDKDLTKSN